MGYKVIRAGGGSVSILGTPIVAFVAIVMGGCNFDVPQLKDGNLASARRDKGDNQSDCKKVAETWFSTHYRTQSPTPDGERRVRLADYFRSLSGGCVAVAVGGTFDVQGNELFSFEVRASVESGITAEYWIQLANGTTDTCKVDAVQCRSKEEWQSLVDRHRELSLLMLQK